MKHIDGGKAERGDRVKRGKKTTLLVVETHGNMSAMAAGKDKI